MVGFYDLKLGEHKKSRQEEGRKRDRERQARGGRRFLGWLVGERTRETMDQ